MEFWGDCQGIFGHFRKLSDLADTQFSKVGPVYAIGCMGVLIYAVGWGGVRVRTSVLASRGTERTEGRRFGWLPKAFLKRRGTSQSRGTDFA